MSYDGVDGSRKLQISGCGGPTVGYCKCMRGDSYVLMSRVTPVRMPHEHEWRSGEVAKAVFF